MKINTASIEGYAGMTAEQKVAALEGFELDAVPTDTHNTLKTAHDDFKGKYEALLPEDQRKENELKALRRESAINKHTATLTGQGWTAELAGKAAVFKVKAHKIVRQQLPELTEEFAKAQGFEDLSALRRQVMETALHAKQNQARDAFTQNLLDQVMAAMEVTVPESMVEGQLQGLMQELERTVMSQGMQLKDYLEAAQLTVEDLRAHARANAEMAARYELAMMEIVRLEGITVTEEEVQAKYEELVNMYGMSLQQIQAQLPPSRLIHDIKLLRARAVVVDSAKRV